jgi:hypothetical protein
MNIKGLTDQIAQPIYDSFNLVAATPSFNLFQTQVGQGTGSFGTNGSTNAKTYSDTNMDLPGQLPSGFAFQVRGFRVLFPWNVTVADTLIFMNGAFIEFTIGAKVFLRIPARTIPAGNGPFISTNAGSTAAANVAAATSGWPSLQNGFAIGGKPLYMAATENFKITWNYPGATPTITAQTLYQVTNSIPITFMLDGYLGRPVQ